METDNNSQQVQNQEESSYDLGIEVMDLSQFETPRFDLDLTNLDLNL